MSISGSTKVIGGSEGSPGNAGAYVWAGSGAPADATKVYAEITINDLSFIASTYNLGVALCMTTDTNSSRDYYYATVAADGSGTYTVAVGKVVNGSNSTLYSAGVSWSNGDVLSLEKEDDRLEVFKNGTSLGGSFVRSGETSLSTGTWGIIGAGNGNPSGDNFAAGDLAVADLPPLIMAPPASPVMWH